MTSGIVTARYAGLVRRRSVALVVIALCTAAGCGSAAAPQSQSRPTPGVSASEAAPSAGTSTASQDDPATGTSAAGGQTSGADTSGQSAQPGAQGQPTPEPTATQSLPTHAPGTIPADVEATLAERCVTPGATQALTVTAKPGFYITIDSQYADGKDGRKYGGYFVGQIPANGKLVLPFQVAPAAPDGKATVWIAVEGGDPVESAFRHPTFSVADSC